MNYKLAFNKYFFSIQKFKYELGLYLSTVTKDMKYIRLVHQGVLTNNFPSINGITTPGASAPCIVKKGLVLVNINDPTNSISCNVRMGP